MTNKITKKAAAKASVLVGALGALLHFPIDLFGALWVSVGSIFPALSISAFTFGSYLPAWMPVGALEVLALLVGGIYVVKLLYNAFNKMENNL